MVGTAWRMEGFNEQRLLTAKTANGHDTPSLFSPLG